jgi:hypothetical protein
VRWLVAGLLAAACTTNPRPTPTGTECADPNPVTGTSTLTWDNFGQAFMTHYCTMCHSSALPEMSMRNGAPLWHDFDTLKGVIGPIPHIDEQAGWGPKARNNFMPGAGTGGRCPSVPGGPLDEDCPEPTDQERTDLAQWLACEQVRHRFTDAGIDSAPGD